LTNGKAEKGSKKEPPKQKNMFVALVALLGEGK
jgi:hypothetical protein